VRSKVNGYWKNHAINILKSWENTMRLYQIDRLVNGKPTDTVDRAEITADNRDEAAQDYRYFLEACGWTHEEAGKVDLVIDEVDWEN